MVINIFFPHNYAKINIVSGGDLPLEQALTLHNVMVHIKLFFSKNHTATAIYCVEFFFFLMYVSIS